MWPWANLFSRGQFASLLQPKGRTRRLPVTVTADHLDKLTADVSAFGVIYSISQKLLHATFEKISGVSKRFIPGKQDMVACQFFS